MVTDSFALALAAVAAWIARRPATARHSFGLDRIEVLAALVNAVLMLVVIGVISWSAIDRLLHPAPVQGFAVAVVAVIGLVLNILVAWLLSRGEKTLNTRAALLHVMGDLLGSVAALAAGVVIYLTGWTPIDPLLSLFICALILVSTLNLVRETVHTLLEGVPREISLPEVGQRMVKIERVLSIHDLHIWSLSSNRIALSAHVVLNNLADWEELLPNLNKMLKTDFGITHTTLQPEALIPSLYAISDPEIKVRSKTE